MTLKIKFRVLLTQCGEPIENGELIIKEGEIVAISPVEEEAEETLDLSDHLLMPGFVNAHCHLGLSALANKLSPAKTFANWIGDLIPLNAALSDEERMRAVGMGADEMKGSGVTGLADYVADPALLVPIFDLGFRSVLFLETIGFQEEKAEAVAEEVETILKNYESNCKLGIAPHAPYSVSAKLWQRLDKLAKKYGCLLSTHLAETNEEIQFIEKGGGPLVDLLKDRQVFDMNWRVPGMSPARYLKSMNVLSGTVAVHCNFIDYDMDAVQAVVFCPKSTRWFRRNHIPPVRKMLDAGIRVALGTDSLASNDSLNFLEEIRMADKLLPDVSRKEILMMATRFGGEILHLPCGKMEIGQKADIIGFQVTTQDEGWYDLPFDPLCQNVDFYMVDGKIRA